MLGWWCSHKRFSFPQSQRPGKRIAAARLTGTYVVCLECGSEFAYDWDKMRIVLTSGKQRVKQKKIEANLEG